MNYGPYLSMFLFTSNLVTSTNERVKEIIDFRVQTKENGSDLAARDSVCLCVGPMHNKEQSSMK